MPFANLPILTLSVYMIGWLIIIQILYATALRWGRIDIYLWVRALLQFFDVILVATLLVYSLFTSEIEGVAITITVCFIFAATRTWHAIELSRSGFKLNQQR